MLDARCTSDERCFFWHEKAQNAQKAAKNEPKRALSTTDFTDFVFDGNCGFGC